MNKLRSAFNHPRITSAIQSWKIITLIAVVCMAALGGYSVKDKVDLAAATEAGESRRELGINAAAEIVLDETDNGFHILSVTPTSIWNNFASGANKGGIAVTYLIPDMAGKDPYNESHWIGVYKGSVNSNTKQDTEESWNWATYNCGSFCTATIDLSARKGEKYTIVYYDKSDCGAVTCGYRARAKYEYIAI
ncbi:hypothetical protein GCM10010278_84720 [Streptomyces melanogenes]|nr:hypothetical protein GCM10010278_84720 [Streptomyces melanogenes]